MDALPAELLCRVLELVLVDGRNVSRCKLVCGAWLALTEDLFEHQEWCKGLPLSWNAAHGHVRETLRLLRPCRRGHAPVVDGRYNARSESLYHAVYAAAHAGQDALLDALRRQHDGRTDADAESCVAMNLVIADTMYGFDWDDARSDDFDPQLWPEAVRRLERLRCLARHDPATVRELAPDEMADLYAKTAARYNRARREADVRSLVVLGPVLDHLRWLTAFLTDGMRCGEPKPAVADSE